MERVTKPYQRYSFIRKGDFPTKNDIGGAKNYLNEKELKVLNNIVSGYFDFAEIQAMGKANEEYQKYQI